MTALLAGALLLVTAGSIDAGENRRDVSCNSSHLTIATGFQISPGTGQNPLTVRLTNRSRWRCSLFGHPKLSFSDEHGSVPFAVSYRGDQMVAPRRPERVVVQPGGSAFVLVNKYRCDLGDLRLARTLRLGLPGTSASLRLELPRYPRWGYCGKGDSGSTVATSAFVPSLAQAMRRPG
jgi:hypothetical protein